VLSYVEYVSILLSKYKRVKRNLPVNWHPWETSHLTVILDEIERLQQEAAEKEREIKEKENKNGR
jgi:DNA polymerase III delta prime subunit